MALRITFAPFMTFGVLVATLLGMTGLHMAMLGSLCFAAGFALLTFETEEYRDTPFTTALFTLLMGMAVLTLWLTEYPNAILRDSATYLRVVGSLFGIVGLSFLLIQWQKVSGSFGKHSE